MTDNSIAELQPLLDDVANIGVGMMTTRDGSVLRSRPMYSAVDKANGALLMFSRAGDHKLDELKEDPRVELAFIDTRDDRYISVSGNAEVVEDPEQAKQLASSEMLEWFRGNVKSEELRLIRVTVAQAERWDVRSDSMNRAWQVHSTQEPARSPATTDSEKVKVSDHR